jgi:Uma2 family endonuclease
MSTIAKPAAAPAPPRDPFYYGWRDVSHVQPDGSTTTAQVPLTLDDHLHPQEGDKFMEGTLHNFLRGFLADVCRSRVQNDPSALVLSDTGVYWDRPELRHHSPDVAVIFGIRQPRDEGPSFAVAAEGKRPRIIIELVTPRYRENDVVTKLHQYHQARVPVYVILDREHEGDPWVIRAYQRRPRGYVPLPLDENGRLWLEDLNLWLGVEGLRVRCFDGDTGEELGDYTAVARRAAEEKARADAEAARADAEKNRADAAEARLRELEAELARLRSQAPSVPPAPPP